MIYQDLNEYSFELLALYTKDNSSMIMALEDMGL